MSYFDFMVLENAIKQYEQRIRSLLDKK
jgi:hypothetical protein